jgi:hypothetical protein
MEWKVTREVEVAQPGPGGQSNLKTRHVSVQTEYAEDANKWAVTIRSKNGCEKRSWVDVDLPTALNHLRDELDLEMVRLHA